MVAVAPPARATETNMPGTPLLYLHSAEVLLCLTSTLQRYFSTSTLQRYFPTTLCRGTPLAVPPLCRGTILLSALYIAEVLPALHSPYFHSAKTTQPLQFLQVLCNQGLSNQVTKILLCLTSFRTSILYSALFYTADTPLVFHKLQR